jgi:hypothetical protein
MKRFFFMALLILNGGPAYSEWEAVGNNVETDTIYVDLETFRRKGDLAEIWVMTDSKLAKRFLDTNLFFLSVRQLQQFNCGEERTRILDVTWFSSNMRQGHCDRYFDQRRRMETSATRKCWQTFDGSGLQKMIITPALVTLRRKPDSQ